MKRLSLTELRDYSRLILIIDIYHETFNKNKKKKVQYNAALSITGAKKEISRDLSWNLDLAEDKTEKYFLIKSLSHCPSY